MFWAWWTVYHILNSVQIVKLYRKVLRETVNPKLNGPLQIPKVQYHRQDQNTVFHDKDPKSASHSFVVLPSQSSVIFSSLCFQSSFQSFFPVILSRYFSMWFFLIIFSNYSQLFPYYFPQSFLSIILSSHLSLFFPQSHSPSQSSVIFLQSFFSIIVSIVPSHLS